MQPLILNHFWVSPFAHKTPVALGLFGFLVIGGNSSGSTKAIVDVTDGR